MVGVAFVLLLSLVAFFLVRTVTHHPPSVNLPQETQGESGGEIATDTAGDSVRRVEVTPQTVQLVIERLARAENYSRTVMIERSWSDGSATASASVVVAVAGMEGALASVVGGLVSCPVVAVPTSVGYGAAFGGVSALLAMLNSCAAGVSVVNIDNGFGAGFLAHRINHMGLKRQ